MAGACDPSRSSCKTSANDMQSLIRAPVCQVPQFGSMFLVDTQDRSQLDAFWRVEQRCGQQGLESLRNGLEYQAGMRLIQARDAHIRLSTYTDQAQRISRSLLEKFDAMTPEQAFALDANGVPVHEQLKQSAYQQRSVLLEKTRQRLSPGGRRLSEVIKDQSPPLNDLSRRYAAEQLIRTNPKVAQSLNVPADAPRTSSQFRAAVKQLAMNAGEFESDLATAARSPAVSRAVIDAAGRSNRAVTALARVSRVAGPIAAGAGVALSVHEVMAAPEGKRLYVAGREASGFAGGTIAGIGGGVAGAYLASLACGPGAPVCALVVTVVVIGTASYAGGALGESAFEHGAAAAARSGAASQPRGGASGSW